MCLKGEGKLKWKIQSQNIFEHRGNDLMINFFVCLFIVPAQVQIILV